MSEFDKELDVDIEEKDGKIEISYDGHKIAILNHKNSDSLFTLYVGGSFDKSVWEENYGADADGNRGVIKKMKEIEDLSVDYILLKELDSGEELEITDSPQVDKELLEEIMTEIIFDDEAFWEEYY